MGLRDTWKQWKENRAEQQEEVVDLGSVGADLISALLATEQMGADKVMEIPEVSGTVDLIGAVVAATPIRLYDKEEDTVSELTDDRRVQLLNVDTGDTMNPAQFWRAVIRDYMVGKGAYIFVDRDALGNICALRYVEERYVSVQMSQDPIYKTYILNVGGRVYYPHEFIKIIRRTSNGARGVELAEEYKTLMSLAYAQMVFERNQMARGGNKKGFLKAAHKLTNEAIEALKGAFRLLYSNNKENVVVLNDGIDFKESSNNAMELQLNESKKSMEERIAELFHTAPKVLKGMASMEEMNTFYQVVSNTIFSTIEKALNQDLLRESEKDHMYFAFDTKALLRVTMKERFEAYEIGIRSNVLQLDEARKMENLPALGIDMMRLSLGDVLYNPKTGAIYTANTDKSSNIKKTGGKEEDED
ncbi:MAG: phage portal protein [Lachnospiraceae bacterium]|nr:phage portal protein [Lachnospiraceae bacterium]